MIYLPTFCKIPTDSSCVIVGEHAGAILDCISGADLDSSGPLWYTYRCRSGTNTYSRLAVGRKRIGP